MKYNKIIFSLLEKIEKKKIEMESIKIKDLYIKKKEHNEQLKSLINYQNEYIQTLYEKKISGIMINNWNNYNNFLTLLQYIIQNHKTTIVNNDKNLEKYLDSWSKKQIKLKTWKYFNLKRKQKILKSKRLLEQRIISEYTHLQAFKEGL